METGARLVTANALLRMSETTARLELVRGVVVERPFAGRAAGHAAAVIGRCLARDVESRGLGVTYLPLGYHLWSDPDTVRAPSLSFVARARIEQIRELDPDRDGCIPGAPDLAVEITCLWDPYDLIIGKVLDWLAAGTRLDRLVSPACRTVTVYRDRGTISPC